MTGVAAQPWERAVLASVLAASALLTTWALGDGFLWQDEAQTALIARSVLEHGVPMGFDHQNHFSQELGVEYGDDGIWRWHTWLPFYLLAGFFAVFGESTFVARLPFALAGLATVAAVYALASALFRDRRTGLAAAALLGFSVPFLVLSRQCRWYSLVALFAVLALRGYLDLVEGRRRRWGGALLAASLVLSFHTHYLYAAAMAAAVVAHACLWHRDALRSLVMWGAVTLPFCAPWIVWLAAGMEYAQVYGDTAFDLGASASRATAYAGKLFTHAFPPVLAVAAAALGALAWRRRGTDWLRGPTLWRPLSLLGLVAASHWIALSLVSPGPFFRYLTPLLPVLAIAGGAVAAAGASVHRAVPALIVAAGVMSAPIFSFLGELAEDFHGPVEAIVTLLREEASEDDVVAISYGDMPLKFYTPLRVVGGLTGEPLDLGDGPDWVILRRNVVVRDRDGRVRDTLRAAIDPSRYRRIELPAVDTRFENREEPHLHRYRTAERGEPVVVLRRLHLPGARAAPRAGPASDARRARK